MAELYKSATDLMKTARGNKAIQSNLCDIIDFQQIVDDTPTADVVEVKHGEWKFNSDGSGTCSECHFTQRGVWDYDNHQHYCGVCGARMDVPDTNDGE